MPWTYDDPPAVAQGWTEAEQQRCVDAANAVLEDGGSDQDAIYACIAAAGKGDEAVERKTYTGGMTLKADGEEGDVIAAFATLNVIDHQNDVTVPGAFTEGEPVRIAAWNHGWNQLPVGKGEIHEDGDEAILVGRFFLNTQTGREHYETVKALGALQEWSYSFDILDASYGEFEGKQVRFLRKLKVHEVSPVMLGAGIGTHTRAIKSGDDREEPDDGKDGDVTPSGPVPSVVRTQVEIALLEE